MQLFVVLLYRHTSRPLDKSDSRPPKAVWIYVKPPFMGFAEALKHPAYSLNSIWLDSGRSAVSCDA